MNTSEFKKEMHAYLDAGMALVFFPSTSKGPIGSAAKGWNLRENCVTRENADKLDKLTGQCNVGLAHAYSGTCSLDIDDLFAAREWLAHHGVALDALYNADDSVTIESGRKNRGKLIYRLPKNMPQKKIASPNGGDMIDFRCAAANGNTVQDCLPPAYNPDAKAHYQWGGDGDYRNIPEIPQELLTLWQRQIDKPTETATGEPLPERVYHGDITALDDLSLSNHTRKLIREGVEKGKRHQNILGAAMDLIRAGATDELVLDVLTNPEFGIAEKALQRGRGNVEAAKNWLKGTIKTAHTKLAEEAAKEETPVRVITREDTKVDFPLADMSANDGDAIGQPEDYLVPYDWMVDGWLYEGAFTFSGAHGVGKTTAIVPMCAAIAGLVRYDGINVHQWRHIVYIAEDVSQVKRVLYGLQSQLGADNQLIDERFHIGQAHRKAPASLTAIYEAAAELHRTIEIGGASVTIPPLVVFDTASANIAVASENENTPVSDAIRTIREQLKEVPFILVCHTAKAMKRADAIDMSSRGAGAWEADVQGVFYLFRDEDTEQGVIYGGAGVKRRDSGEVKELTIDVDFGAEPRPDRYGRTQMVPYPIVTLTVGDADERAERGSEQKKQAKAEKRENELIGASLSIRQAIKKAQAIRDENPTSPDGYLSKETLTGPKRTKYGKWGQKVGRAAISALIEAGQIVALPVPKGTFENQRGTPTFLTFTKSEKVTGFNENEA